ncbi:PAS domain-containing protein [Ideonella sp.]|uniref:PAS domain-containing hybrid sensor histidine kinase/response regulator n=1 Tax=Ideonella sp. TaxID=1929293 RepID=UPI003BB7E7A7
MRLRSGLGSSALLSPWTLALVLAALLSLTLSAIAWRTSEHQQLIATRVAFVADLREQQIATWLTERRAESRFVQSSRYMAELLEKHSSGDTEALTKLMQRMAEFRRDGGAHAVLVVDDAGQLIASEPPNQALGGQGTRLAIEIAAETTTSQFAIPEQNARSLDLVIPYALSGTPPNRFAILRIDPQATLLRNLDTWPTPSRSARVSLWRPDAGKWQPITPWDGPINPPASAPAGSTLPPALPWPPAPNQPANAQPVLDPRGMPVMAAMRAIAGTDWVLLAQIDQSEIQASQRFELLTIATTGLLAAAALVLARRSLRQHEALQQSQTERDAKARHLRDLALVTGITQGTSDLIFAKNLAGQYLVFNPGAGQPYPMRPEDVIGRTDRDLYNEEEAAALRAEDAQVMRTLQIEHFQRSWPGQRPYLVTKGPLRDEAGQLIGLYGVLRDQTEHHALQRVAEEEAELRRLILEHSHDGMVVIDDQGAIFLHNAAFATMLGHTPDELAGLRRSQWEPGNTGQHDPHPCTDSGPNPNAALKETQLRHANGHFFDAEVSSVALHFKSRNLLLCTYRNIAERKRMEAELLRHRNHLEQLVAERSAALELAIQARLASMRFTQSVTDNMPGAVSYWGEDLRCRFANKAYAQWFNTEPGALIGKPVQEVLGPVELEVSLPRLQAALQGETQQFERTLMRGAGLPIQTWTTYVPDIQGDKVRGVFAAFHDITELKQSERRLLGLNSALQLATDKAEAASRAKSAFLANMSHEIRTPMNAIIGLTHLMQGEVEDPVQQKRLQGVSDAAQHLLGVISDILDLSKIEAGKMALEQIDFHLPSMVQRMASLVSDRLHAKAIAMETDLTTLPDWLHGDEIRLSQAVLNLLNNASKFTEQGTIQLRCVLAERTGAELLVRFEVHDTGIGVAEEQLARLFQPFEQADPSATRRFGGSGLGLAITRRLAELMGGQAGVISELGKGSCFWFTARLQAAQSAPTTASPALGDIGSQVAAPAADRRLRDEHAGARILLVEDNPVNCEVATALLQSVDLSVSVAHDGVQAVQVASTERFDLILMDVHMPHMDGLAATRAIRQHGASARSPIVAMTASAFEEDRAACMAAGMNDHIVKPVEPQRLYATMLRWLERAAPGGSSDD